MAKIYKCRICGEHRSRGRGINTTRDTCMQCSKKRPGPVTSDRYQCAICNITRTWNPSRQQRPPTVCKDCGGARFYPPTVDVDWIESANCRSVDPELFYDLSPSGHYKLICDACPVIRQCLKAAHTYRDQHAIWGGLTPNQRQRLTRTGAGPTDTDTDVTRCRNCGGWKEPHLFCWTCHQAALRKRDLA